VGVALPPSHNPPSIRADAESVRAYLVEIRGGAPFLSGADGRLLVRWLEDGIPASAIMAAVDKAAERRRRKRGNGKPPRGRLTLVGCRGLVEKSRQTCPPPRAEAAFDLGPYCTELRAMSVPTNLSAARDALVRAVAAIPAGANADAIAKAATQASRTFHTAAWEATEAEAADLRAAATEELAALSSILDTAAFDQAVDAVARDHVRARFPLVSAKAVWDRLQTSSQARETHG
jgi:hypothetical protein